MGEEQKWERGSKKLILADLNFCGLLEIANFCVSRFGARSMLDDVGSDARPVLERAEATAAGPTLVNEMSSQGGVVWSPIFNR
jgi:hypothetical protein